MIATVEQRNRGLWSPLLPPHRAIPCMVAHMLLSRDFLAHSSIVPGVGAVNCAEKVNMGGCEAIQN